MKKIYCLGLIWSQMSFAGVFCKTDGNIIEIAKSQVGYACIEELAMGAAVCFTGKRAVAIKTMNSKAFRDAFEGTDGEYVKDAHFSGRDSIAYTFVDEANSYEEKLIMNRCDRDFFEFGN